MSWKDAEAAFEKALPGYESREHQRLLAEKIEKGLTNRRHTLGQAGTGTGKSFAGLVPGIFHSLETGMPFAVVTSTKALQDQYVNDLEFLQRIFREHMQTEITFSVLKGRGNYLCRAKLNELGPDSVFNQISLLEEIDSTEELSGDLDELITELDMRDRPKLTSSSDECPGKSDCPFGETCFAVKARERAKTVNVVVANHSLFAKDMQLREMSRGDDGKSTISLLPDLGGVAIDEGHEFQENVTNALGSELARRSLEVYETEVVNFVKSVDDVEVNAKVRTTAGALFDSLDEFLGKDPSRTISANKIFDFEDEFVALFSAIKAAHASVKDVQVHGDDREAQRRKRLLKRGNGLIERLKQIMFSDDAELVRWAERDEKRGTLLKFAPLFIGDFLAENLWSQMPAVILSATLAMGDDFSFIAENLGLREYDSYNAGTPFDYPRQSAMYVPDGFNPVGQDRENWQAKVAATIPELVRAAGGRTLLLFTSTKAMNKAFFTTQAALRRIGVTVMKQGDKPNKQLAEIFKSDQTSVLFALKSFMTGIDVQGDSLRLVILDKLPFVNPEDVIFQARCEVIDDKATAWNEKSFMKLAIPSMALVLQQAIGRLIRTRSDEGMVAILDSRLTDPKKYYMRKVRASLPPSRKVDDLDDAVAYLEDLKTRRG